MTHKKDHTPSSSWIPPRVARRRHSLRSADGMHHSNKRKDKVHMVISVSAEKVLDKIQHLFMIKTLTKTGIEGTYVNVVKAINDKPIVNIILKAEKLNGILLSRKNEQNSVCCHIYVESKKKIDTNILKTQTHRHRKQTTVTHRERGDESGVWGF